MKPAQEHDAWFVHALGAVLVAAGAALGAAAAALPGALLGGAVGLGGASWLRQRQAGEKRRREAVLAAPFPERWRRLLLERYDHFERLPPELRHRFEDDVRLFLAEKRITGVGVEVTDELRLLVAASAVTLSLGWPDYDWEPLTEVLLYPQDFDRDYGFEAAELSGQAHAWGTVILSVPSLLESFEHPDDAYHVGLHEFAHLLELKQTAFEGVPAGLDDEQARAWTALARREMARLQKGRSVLDDYGADDPVEFLAVAVEAFFEVPQELRRRHRELYDVLARWFRQDPAAWDDRRGL